MKAFVCTGITEDLSGTAIMDVPVPEPGPGEVRVRVKAASVNFPDMLMCQGKYQFKPEPPFIPGLDVAGIVSAVGEGVTSFKIGDEVVGGGRHGGFAEEAILSASGLFPKPESLSWGEAASYPVAYLTAYVALVRRGDLKAGDTVLVHGAAGGVGMAAVDVAKLLGATVIATSASDEKLKVLKAYGADHTLNTTGGFREAVKALTGGRGADIIYDPIGGDVFDESTRCIAFDGRLLVIGFASGRIPTVSVNMPLIKGFSVVGVRAGEYGRQFPDRGAENLATIHGWAREGKIRPHVGAELPLERTLDALMLLRDRKIIGKAVITP